MSWDGESKNLPQMQCMAQYNLTLSGSENLCIDHCLPRQKYDLLLGQLLSVNSLPAKRRKPSSYNLSPELKYPIEQQVPKNRRSEILRYLRLFGYKPDRTVLQVHIAGYFNKGSKTRGGSARGRAALGRYAGTTFVVVGRTHDPFIMGLVLRPKKKSELASPGYVGYLWKEKNVDHEVPHDLLPLDFTPMQLPYPTDWKARFGTKGFMIAMHVPTLYASRKNQLIRALYRIGKKADVKQNWDFLDELQGIGYKNWEASERAQLPSNQAPNNHNRQSVA